jgi:hypothetical protein
VSAWTSSPLGDPEAPSPHVLARRLPRRPLLVASHWCVAVLLIAFPVLTVVMLPGVVQGQDRPHLVVEILIAAVVTRLFCFVAGRWFRTNNQAVTALLTRDGRVAVAQGSRVVDAVADRLVPGLPAHEPARRPALLPPVAVACTGLFLLAGWLLHGRPAAFISGIILGVALGLVHLLVDVHRAGASGDDRLEHVVIVPLLAAHRRVTGRPLPEDGIRVEDLYRVLREHPEAADVVVQRIRATRIFPMLTARASFTEGISLWLP